jgi:hypothetical protein
VELEKRGIPVATVCTDEFLALGKAEAAVLGMPGLPIVIIPHPMAGQSPGRVAEIAGQALNEIVHVLISDAKKLEKEYKEKTCVRPKKRMRYKALFGDDFSSADAPDKFKGPDSLEAVNKLFYYRGWTDGLPIIPPTVDRLERMISHSVWDPKTLIGRIMPGRGEATVEKIAVNAIMAGCLPKHLPIVIAATKAIVQEAFNLYAIQTTTHPCTVLLLINGPLVNELDINYGYNAMGQGTMSNATIGRALRLILINIGGAAPGLLDMATQGGPAKYSFCFAENEEENPWEPFHVERGFDKSISTITVMGAEGPHNVNDHGSSSAEEILLTIAGVLATPGLNNIYTGGEPLIILGPEHASIIARDGFSKSEVKQFLFEHARVPLKLFSGGNLERLKKTTMERLTDLESKESIPVVNGAEDIMVVVAGGRGRHSAIVPTFGGYTRAITVPVNDQDGCPDIISGDGEKHGV